MPWHGNDQACTESPTLFPDRWLFFSRFRYGALPGSFPFPSPPSLRLRSALSTMVDHGHTTVIKAEMERFMHVSSDVSAQRKTSSSGPVTPSCAGQADVCLVRQSIKKVVRDSIGRQRGKLESLGGGGSPPQQAGVCSRASSSPGNCDASQLLTGHVRVECHTLCDLKENAVRD